MTCAPIDQLRPPTLPNQGWGTRKGNGEARQGEGEQLRSGVENGGCVIRMWV